MEFIVFNLLVGRIGLFGPNHQSYTRIVEMWIVHPKMQNWFRLNLQLLVTSRGLHK